ncbi:MAG TPA: hypothetical protein DCZ75_03375 [Geobacter sp.]|nr:hypothetical protein [Geobacter sp.]
MLAFALIAAGSTLTGCGSSNNASSYGSEASSQAKVTLAARFPTPDGAVKSLLPDGAQAIEVYAMPTPYTQGGSETLIATLTPAAPTATVKLAPGLYMINATAYDSTDRETRSALGYTSTGGEILADAVNTVNLTFLNGQWTLNTPIVLSDGTQLNDFVAGSGDVQIAATKSRFDFSKPIGGGSGELRYRFSNNTSARTYGDMIAQFVGTSNSIALFGSDYNLTQKCSDCEEAVGDRLVMIDGQPDGATSSSESSDSYNQGDLLQGSGYELLPGKGADVFMQNGTVIDFFSKVPAATSDGKTITGNLLEVLLTGKSVTLKTASAAKKVKAAKIVKAQSANTPYTGLTVTSSQYKLCSPTGGTNTGNWYFSNQSPIQIGAAICYDWGYQMTYQGTGSGDYSYGLAPTDTNNLGDYCQVWDFQTNTCQRQLPVTGEVYMPYNFYAKRSATKTAIDYGSFKFNFWVEETTSGTVYVYPFTATGSAKVSPAK